MDDETVVTRAGYAPNWAARHRAHGEPATEQAIVAGTQLRGWECPCGAQHFAIVGEATR